MKFDILFESFIVGFFLVIITYLFNMVDFGLGMYQSVFVIGALFHIIFEMLGINRMYIESKSI